MKNIFKVVLCHFHLYKKNTLVVQGYFPYDNPEGYRLDVCINGQSVSYETKVNESNEVRRRYVAGNENVSMEYILEIEVNAGDELEIFCKSNSDKSQVLKFTAGEIKKLKEKYYYNIDSSVVGDNTIRLIGWTATAAEEVFHLYEGDTEVPLKVKRSYRKDVVGFYQELKADSEPGFELEFEKKEYKKLQLIIESNGRKIDCNLDTAKTLAGGNPIKDRSIAKRFVDKIKKAGVKNTLKAISKNVDKSQSTQHDAYMDFVKRNALSTEELELQRQTKFNYEPLMSFVIPMYKTPEKYLAELIDSIVGQTYSNWELCLADGSEDDSLGAFIKDKYPNDERIKYTHLEKNAGISDNTNAAIKLAQGDFIVLSDHDDTLALDALYECVKTINENPECDVIYSDEDKVSMEGDIYFDPSFKPDFNIDYLRSVNYICHLFVFKKEIYEKAGALNKEFDGAQDHDFILRCIEVASKVCHIPRVLYHWRCHIDSTAMNLESKLYALDNGARAVEEHLKRVGIPAKVERGEFYGTYRTRYEWGREPLVSIIIPTKDHSDDLKKCIDSIENKSSYRNFEFVIVENNSVEAATFDYYETIKNRENVTLVTYEGGFNFSAINNLGVASAKGEFLLLLNNDTEIINADCIKEMVDVALRPEVGICGARLYYPDNTIQHAGVVMGIGGIAGHSFVGFDKSAPGYMYRAAVAQDLTAVTAACLMIKRDVFDKVNGLTEELAVAFNDVDLCLKVRRAGYLVVYNPFAELYHYESKSRGYEDSAEKQARFNRETEKLESLWPGLLKAGDPYYNRNLSLVDGSFKLG